MNGLKLTENEHAEINRLLQRPQMQEVFEKRSGRKQELAHKVGEFGYWPSASDSNITIDQWGVSARKLRDWQLQGKQVKPEEHMENWQKSRVGFPVTFFANPDEGERIKYFLGVVKSLIELPLPVVPITFVEPLDYCSGCTQLEQWKEAALTIYRRYDLMRLEFEKITDPSYFKRELSKMPKQYSYRMNAREDRKFEEYHNDLSDSDNV